MLRKALVDLQRKASQQRSATSLARCLSLLEQSSSRQTSYISQVAVAFGGLGLLAQLHSEDQLLTRPPCRPTRARWTVLLLQDLQATVADSQPKRTRNSPPLSQKTRRKQHKQPQKKYQQQLRLTQRSLRHQKMKPISMRT